MNKKKEIIDIHSHIIPGIDDGAENIETSLEMLEISIQDGVTEIIVTPHYRAGLCLLTFEEVKKQSEKLEKVFKNIGGKIKIHCGQEVYFTENLLDDLENKIIGTLANSRYLLLELSTRKFDEKIFDTIYELKLRNIMPIIAHPERYIYIQRHPDLINKLIQEGCLLQLNAGSIIGRYGETVKKTAMKLLKNKVYSFIGSDSHNTAGRKSCISEGLEIISKIDKDFEIKTKENSKKLLLNEEIILNTKMKKRKIFSFFRCNTDEVKM